MMQNYSVDLPCKKYIKKYYTTVYGERPSLDHRSDFGDTILTKMSSSSLAQVNKKMLQLEFQHYKDQIKFTLPMDFFYRVSCKLSEQQIYNINRFLENCFETDLFLIISIGRIFGVEKISSIRTFARKYQIELDEDISTDALLQAEYRFRKTHAAQNFFLLQLSGQLKSTLRA